MNIQSNQQQRQLGFGTKLLPGKNLTSKQANAVLEFAKKIKNDNKRNTLTIYTFDKRRLVGLITSPEGESLGIAFAGLFNLGKKGFDNLNKKIDRIYKNIPNAIKTHEKYLKRKDEKIQSKLMSEKPITNRFLMWYFKTFVNY